MEKVNAILGYKANSKDRSNVVLESTGQTPVLCTVLFLHAQNKRIK